MKDLSSSLPSSEEILRVLGLQTRAHNEVMPSLALFGAGILVGAGLALLFAPTTGQELRQGISSKAADLAERASATAEQTLGDNGKAAA